MPLTEEMRAAGWIEHDGGPCPVALDSRAQVMFANGGLITLDAPQAGTWTSAAAPDRQDFWTGENLSYHVRIIAYRPEQPHDQ